MKSFLIILITLLSLELLHAQKVISSKDFGNNRSLIIHELPFTKGLEDGFVILKEDKKGFFNFQKFNLLQNLLWDTKIVFDPQLNVPQVLIHQSEALLISFTVKELERNVIIELKKIDLTTGKITNEAKKMMPQFETRSTYPRISISNDLSKILLSHFVPAASKSQELIVLNTEGLTVEKTLQLNNDLFEPNRFNKFVIDNKGNVFFASINEKLFRMDGFFIPSSSTEPLLLQHDIFFTRPMDNVPDVIIEVVEDSTYFIVAATGNIQNELIGVKLVGFDFKNFEITFDTVYNFSFANVQNLYAKSISTSKYVKNGSLKKPADLNGYALQELRIDKNRNMVLFIEKNLQKSTFQKGFNSGNLLYTYNTNTKRQLQKSEDVIIMSFAQNGQLNWGNVVQKYQVTKPFNYQLSYVSGISDDMLNLLTWTKKSQHSLQVTRIDLKSGNAVFAGKDILNNGTFTYHKNYSTWIDGNHLAITTQKNNKLNERTLHVVKID